MKRRLFFAVARFAFRIWRNKRHCGGRIVAARHKFHGARKLATRLEISLIVFADHFIFC